MSVKSKNSHLAHSEKVQRLVAEHQELKDEPLRLAVYYSPKHDSQNVYLLEVAENFGVNTISTDRELFEVEYASTPGFDIEQDGSLHLVLTNPTEFKVAVREQWKPIADIQQAVHDGKYEVIYQDSQAEQLMDMLRG